MGVRRLVAEDARVSLDPRKDQRNQKREVINIQVVDQNVEVVDQNAQIIVQVVDQNVQVVDQNAQVVDQNAQVANQVLIKY
tara:strand:- start:313 stop:555 length:243 start_codon:yes stop_codon:yes gene_type:complete